MTLTETFKRLVVADTGSHKGTASPSGAREGTPSSFGSKMALFRLSSPPTPPPQNTPARTKSQADIFERNVFEEAPPQEEDPISGSPSIPLPKDVRDLPRHLVSEDFTSPILDSTVELIANGDFDTIDVVQVPHRQASLGLLKTCSRSSQSSLPSTPRLSTSRKYSNSSSLTKLNTKTLQLDAGDANIPPCTCACSPLDQSCSPPRKAIPFYSYSDLVNFERMSHMSPASSSSNYHMGSMGSDQEGGFSDYADYNESYNPNCPRHRTQRRGTLQQGANNETEFTIDEQLDTISLGEPAAGAAGAPRAADGPKRASSKNAHDSAQALQVTCEPLPVPEPTAAADTSAEEDESVLVWLPEESCDSHHVPRRKSIVDDLASVKSTATNNSYFENELESEIGEPLINVCSAKDFLRTRSRELRKSFVDNDIATRRYPLEP